MVSKMGKNWDCVSRHDITVCCQYCHILYKNTSFTYLPCFTMKCRMENISFDTRGHFDCS
jgi:hypothetical protein